MKKFKTFILAISIFLTVFGCSDDTTENTNNNQGKCEIGEEECIENVPMWCNANTLTWENKAAPCADTVCRVFENVAQCFEDDEDCTEDATRCSDNRLEACIMDETGTYVWVLETDCQAEGHRICVTDDTTASCECDPAIQCEDESDICEGDTLISCKEEIGEDYSCWNVVRKNCTDDGEECNNKYTTDFACEPKEGFNIIFTRMLDLNYFEIFIKNLETNDFDLNKCQLRAEKTNGSEIFQLPSIIVNVDDFIVFGYDDVIPVIPGTLYINIPTLFIDSLSMLYLECNETVIDSYIKIEDVNAAKRKRNIMQGNPDITSATFDTEWLVVDKIEDIVPFGEF